MPRATQLQMPPRTASATCGRYCAVRLRQLGRPRDGRAHCLDCLCLSVLAAARLLARALCRRARRQLLSFSRRGSPEARHSPSLAGDAGTGGRRFCFFSLQQVITMLVITRILLQFFLQQVGVIVLRVQRPDLAAALSHSALSAAAAGRDGGIRLHPGEPEPCAGRAGGGCGHCSLGDPDLPVAGEEAGPMAVRVCGATRNGQWSVNRMQAWPCFSPKKRNKRETRG